MVRFLASLAIIYWHVPDLYEGPIISWSLLAFVTISILYGRWRNAEPLRAYVQRIGQRLLVPWILWSAVYIGLRGLGRLDNLALWLESAEPKDFLVGGAKPLWYLPYIFLVLAIDSIARWTFDRTVKSGVVMSVATIALAGGVAVSGAIFASNAWTHAGAPLSQYAFVLPTTLASLAWGSVAGSRLVGVRAIALFVVALAGNWVLSRNVGQAMAGVLGFSIVVILRGRWVGRGATPALLGQLALPIYLTHSIFIGVFYKAGLDGRMVFVLSCIGSCAVSYGILRSSALSALLVNGNLSALRKQAS